MISFCLPFFFFRIFTAWRLGRKDWCMALARTLQARCVFWGTKWLMHFRDTRLEGHYGH